MKIYHSLVIILTFSLLLSSCDNTTNLEKTSPPIEVDDHNHDANESIVLNNGKKWKVDETMMPPIRSMENAISAISKSKEKDYNTLAEELQASIETLTSNCTMTGQAHDELHKWLLPYIDLVDELSATTNEADAQLVFKRINESFSTFNTYFH